MKFVISKKKLVAAINHCLRAIDSRATLPVLGNILIEAKKDKLILLATNLEISVQSECEANIQNEGAITIPAKILASYVGLVAGEKIECELLENQTLKIAAPGSETEIRGITADEFPVIPGIDKKQELSLSAPVLARALEQVIFAAASDPSRPILNSILVWVSGDELRLAATNSYQLAEKKIPLLKAEKSETRVLIPVRAATELAAMLTKESETVLVKIGENQAGFEVGHTSFITRLIDGNFPDYGQIIPEKSETTALVATEDLLIALRRVSLFADAVSSKAKIGLAKDKITIVSNTGQVGKDEASLAAKIDGKGAEIALNASYLVNMLNHAGAAEVELGVTDATKPAVLRPKKDKNYTYVVMPLKLD